MIMLPTVVRNLFGGPATRMYPVDVRDSFPRARGHVEFNEDLCNQCGNCVRRCPAIAIDLDKENKLWILHPDRCILLRGLRRGVPQGCDHHRSQVAGALLYTGANRHAFQGREREERKRGHRV